MRTTTRRVKIGGHMVSVVVNVGKEFNIQVDAEKKIIGRIQVEIDRTLNRLGGEPHV